MAGVRKDEYSKIRHHDICTGYSGHKCCRKSCNPVQPAFSVQIYASDERIAAIVNQNSAPLNHNEAEITGYRDALNEIHSGFEFIRKAGNGKGRSPKTHENVLWKYIMLALPLPAHLHSFLFLGRKWIRMSPGTALRRRSLPDKRYSKIFTELEAVAKVQSIKSSNAIEGIVTSDEHCRPGMGVCRESPK